MPAPVRSRSSFTICALMLAIGVPLSAPISSSQAAIRSAQLENTREVRCHPVATRQRSDADCSAVLLCGQLFRLRDPALHPAGQSDLLTDRAGSVGPEPRDLPVVEDTEVIELLLDRRRDMVQLLEIVGDAARSGQHLVTGTFGCRR